jgi:hypothetical protein
MQEQFFATSSMMIKNEKWYAGISVFCVADRLSSDTVIIYGMKLK